jgi:hypothetical protein
LQGKFRNFTNIPDYTWIDINYEYSTTNTTTESFEMTFEGGEGENILTFWIEQPQNYFIATFAEGGFYLTVAAVPNYLFLKEPLAFL